MKPTNQNYSRKEIFADPEVQIALKEMPILALPNFDTLKHGFTIFLHNIQSLNKHFKDLKKDPRCWNADIICLTETWIKSGQNVSAFEIDGFSFHQSARGDVYNDSNAQVLQLQSSKVVLLFTLTNLDRKTMFIRCLKKI